MLSSSNQACDNAREKSVPMSRDSISVVACVGEDKVRLARSHCAQKMMEYLCGWICVFGNGLEPTRTRWKSDHVHTTEDNVNRDYT